MEKYYIEQSDLSKLYYRIYGNGEHTILLLHGLVGGSWLGEEWINAIERSNVRCVAVERPGYGDSSAVHMESVRDWTPLVQSLLQKLNVSSADVIGCSAGAPYAYATALAAPNKINKVFILGGVPAVYESKILHHYRLEDQEAYYGFIHQTQGNLQKDYVKQMEAALHQFKDTNISYIINTLREILAQRCFGMAQESRLQILPWNLELSQIKAPVYFYHAKEDEMVPYSAAREMIKFLNNCEFHEADTAEIPSDTSTHIGSITWSFRHILDTYSNNAVKK
ncbi:alpha/beta hydrolase [Sinanaerobacter sp. ZZT-01]|uniref:alpha/beta fold hydrolase n=1 Tax=Sinanaerobacter sp. ZZT-01 TaxID=3111540 RepID=UPI002D78C0DD|nr:alpha/beta hydrolase [Sinanaerobacter sp. ZZT-01]WRR93672.1 alpha/beta hydrolase [Sinanaerobacter sp. ZZT-01]